MKRRIISAVVYAATFLALAGFFDSLYGAGPVTGYLAAIHLALAGTVLLAAASISSFFAPRVGVVCGAAGSVLAWPCFAAVMPTIPWPSIFSILPYSNWQDLLTAILALTVSSIYSVTRLRWLLSDRANWEERNLNLKLAGTLLYAVVIVGEAAWRSIWDWLFRLRYGN